MSSSKFIEIWLDSFRVLCIVLFFCIFVFLPWFSLNRYTPNFFSKWGDADIVPRNGCLYLFDRYQKLIQKQIQRTTEWEASRLVYSKSTFSATSQTSRCPKKRWLKKQILTKILRSRAKFSHGHDFGAVDPRNK